MRSLSLLKYPGGKTRAVHILERFIPDGTTTLYSPFFGGGSFEIYCAREKGIKVFGSDKFEPLTNFWQMVSANKEAVYKAARRLFPITKESFNYYKNNFSKLRNNIKRAAVFFILNKTSFNGQMRDYSGSHSPTAFEAIKSFDSANISISQSDYTDFLKNVPQYRGDVLLYLDPPYPTKKFYYGWNGNMHKNFDHNALANVLSKRSTTSYWILCYKDCEMIRNLYKQYRIERVSWLHSIQYRKDVPISNHEIVIVSDALSARLTELDELHIKLGYLV
jgi:DNA adenine methylase